MRRTTDPASAALVVRHLHSVRVYWEDTDAGGIVFYANYLKFFERARTEWLRGVGLSQQQVRRQTGGMFVVSETALKYHAPARLDDELLITTRVLEKGRASLRVGQQAALVMPGAEDAHPVTGHLRLATTHACLVCTSEVRIGWVDAATLQPARIPNSILDIL